jgi:hypothetical protein
MAALLTHPEPSKASHKALKPSSKAPRHQHCVGKLAENLHKVHKIMEKTQFIERIEDRE